jgi:excisionase family DNA binding protein
MGPNAARGLKTRTGHGGWSENRHNGPLAAKGYRADARPWNRTDITRHVGHAGAASEGGKQMKRDQSSGETLLTPAEVAALFRVDPKTVTRWAKAGKLSSIRTLGGHRRYRESEVMSLLEGVATRNG